MEGDTGMLNETRRRLVMNELSFADHILDNSAIKVNLIVLLPVSK